MNTVTFIHAADLHLGAPFKGLRSLSPAWADILMEAIPESFRKVIDVALSEQVDFVVFAGDVFDNAHPSYADYALFVSGLSQLEKAGIPVYFVTGNHDPYISWDTAFSSLPANTHILGVNKPGFACYERDGQPLALLGGRSYYTQSWPDDEDVSAGISRETAVAELGKRAPFMVGIIHTGLDIDLTRSPVRPKELLKRDVDYWACGHVHQMRIVGDKDNPRVVYSGCPQGRDIKEEGDHGVVKVTLREGKSNEVEFIPTAVVAWKRIALDVSECATIAEIQQRIVSAEFSCNAQSHCQRMIFRVMLEGKTALHQELTDQVLQDMRTVLNDGYPFFYVDSIVNRTQKPLDYKALRQEGLFPAVYLETMDEYRDNKDAVLVGLEKQFYQKELSLPSSLERQFPQLCDDAQTLVLDLLGQDEQ